MMRESWRDIASRVVAALGYLIIWSPKPLKIGQVVRRVSTYSDSCAERIAEHPFVVIGEATEEQFHRQLDCIGDRRGFSQPDYYYYFVETD